MKITQHFTGRGMLGILFFLIGNLVPAFWLASLMTGAAASRAMDGPGALILVVSGLLWVISVPMMLIGREYYVTVTHIPKDAIR